MAGRLLLALVLLIPCSYAANVASSSMIVAPGQTFNLNVSIDPLGTPIAGAQLDLSINKSILKINSVTEGNLFNQKRDNTFFNGGIINNFDGTIVNIFNAIIGKSNVTSPGTFVIVNITAIGSPGTSGVNISNIMISKPDGSPVVLNVINGTVRINSPPVLSPIGDKIIDEGQSLNFSLSASDIDGDTLKFSASNLPSGASFNSVTRTFLWRPDYSQSGTYPNVCLEVYDGFNRVYENISIIVNNAYPISDVNENRIVDIGDLAIIGQHFKENTGIPFPRYDVNKDGIVDIADITITAQNLGEST